MREVLHDADIPNSVDGIIRKGQGENIAADPDVHGWMAAFQHRAYQVHRHQGTSTIALVDQHRGFRCPGTGLDEHSFARKVAIDEIRNRSGEDRLTIKTEEALGET